MYKVTVNRVSKLDNYPIPKTEGLFVVLGGGVRLDDILVTGKTRN